MKVYRDQEDSGNLDHLTHEPNPLLFENKAQIKMMWRAGFKYGTIDNIDSPGVYPVSVRNYVDFWSGCVLGGPSKHVLYEIPLKVIEAARERKVIIVIDNQAEGFPLIRHQTDGYALLHKVMNNLGIPKNYVIIADSNLTFNDQYDSWCAENYTRSRVAHSYMNTGFYYFRDKVPSSPLVLDAIKNPNSYDYLSLNRTARLHRVEHLYYLIKNNMHTAGLVSGHYSNTNGTLIPPSVFLDTSRQEFADVLTSALPLEADGPWSVENPDTSSEHIYNHNLYKNTLLSAVTETAFHQPGVFITEKIFKAIAAGHPFIVLGQYKYLESLKTFGYKTNFPGLDQSYDLIQNPRERFLAFHRTLQSWINIDRKQKLEMIDKWMPIILHNQEMFKTQTHEFDSYTTLLKTASSIFDNTYRKK